MQRPLPSPPTYPPTKLCPVKLLEMEEWWSSSGHFSCSISHCYKCGSLLLLQEMRISWSKEFHHDLTNNLMNGVPVYRAHLLSRFIWYQLNLTVCRKLLNVNLHLAFLRNVYLSDCMFILPTPQSWRVLSQMWKMNCTLWYHEMCG
jgi:hypothetical protein